jgi:hypothetical protein
VHGGVEKASTALDEWICAVRRAIGMGRILGSLCGTVLFLEPYLRFFCRREFAIIQWPRDTGSLRLAIGDRITGLSWLLFYRINSADSW